MQSSSTSSHGFNSCATRGLPSGYPVSENIIPTKEALIKAPHAKASSHSPGPQASQHWLCPATLRAHCTAVPGCRGSLAVGLPGPRRSPAVLGALHLSGLPAVSPGGCWGSLPFGAAQTRGVPSSRRSRCPRTPPFRGSPRVSPRTPQPPFQHTARPSPRSARARSPRPAPPRLLRRDRRTPAQRRLSPAAPRPGAAPVPAPSRSQRRPQCRRAAGEADRPIQPRIRGAAPPRAHPPAPPPPIVCAAEAEQSARSSPARPGVR